MLDFKKCLTRLIAASLALAVVHCASNDDSVDPGAGGSSVGDAGSSGRDAASPELRDGEADAGPTRNPLCGLVGCFPGNLSACGTMPSEEAGQYGNAPGGDAAPDAVRVDAAGSGDAARDAATSDVAATSDGAAVEAATRDAALRDGGAGPDAAPSLDASLTEAGAMGEGGAADDSGTPSAADVERVDAAAMEASVLDASALSDRAAATDVSAVSTPDANAAETRSDATGARSDSAPAYVPPAMSCHITPAAAGVASACEPYGAHADGEPCDDSSDCDASLACVDVNQRAVCRPLRCGLPIACPPGSFYREAALRARGVTRADLVVPVCVPDDHCEVLAATNPCTIGEVCTVVGTAGETSCVIPGRAGVDDACDDANRCANGLVCTKHKNTCVKLCHIGRGNEECMGGACEGGNNSLPPNIGVCVAELSATP